MEIHQAVFIKNLKKSLEVSIAEILNKYPEITNDADLSESELENVVAKIKKSEEIKTITQKFCDYHEYSDLGKHNINLIEHLGKSDLYDEQKLENLVFQFNQNKSADRRLNALEIILRYPALDLVDQSKWPKLSKILRECLLTKNKEIFLNGLKIHLKLSSNSQTIIDATTNILKTLMIVFQSRKIYGHVQGIDFRMPLQDQISKMVNLLLANFRIIFKNYTNYNIGREKLIEGLINNFLDLAIIHSFYDRTDYIHFMYYVFVLDPKAKWFKQLMHTLHYRKIVVSFCFKNTAFLKYIVKEFLHNISVENECCTKKSWKTEISLDIIKFAAMHHCSNILSIILSYKWGHRLFPVEVKTAETAITVHSLITTIIHAIHSLSSLTKQKLKRDLLSETLVTILTKNRHFLYIKDICSPLIRPMKVNERQRLLEIARRNSHILQIINAIANTQDGFFIIFGFIPENHRTARRRHHKHNQYIRSISLQEPLVISTFIEKYQRHAHSANDQHYERMSLGKIICEFTANLLRYQINTSTDTLYIDEIVFLLLECCCNIHALHSHVMSLLNSYKLLNTALLYYKLLINRNLLTNAMNPLLKFFVIICGTRSGTDCILKEDTEVMYILCKHYFFILNENLSSQGCFSMFFINSASTVPGCIAIAECKRQIISPLLNRIWRIEEDEILFLSGSDRLVEEEIFRYMKFIFILHFNFNCVQGLLSNDADDESTLLDADEKPSSLKDLLDDTLSCSGPGTLSCFIGLLTLKLLINNLDSLIFLEQAAHLQDELSLLQSECSVVREKEVAVQNENPIILDECSLMRKNIIDFIHSVGFIKYTNRHKGRHNSSLPYSGQNRRLNEMQRFLNETRNSLHDHNWLTKARNIFKQTCGTHCKEAVFVDLIQHIRMTIPNSGHTYVWPENDYKFPDLFSEDYEGITVIVRFGKKNRLLQPPCQYEEAFAVLLKQVYSFLNIIREKFEGFDWFVGMIFLICGGNLERCKTVFQSLIHFPVAYYIWPTFGNNVGRTKNFNYSIHFDNTLDILIGDLEIFKPALENASISWNFIIRNWVNQCFFNVLEWNEICNFLMVALLYPLEYVLFFIICCAQHLESKFLNAITSYDINVYQTLLQLDGLHMSDCLSSMEQLGKQYKNILSARH